MKHIYGIDDEFNNVSEPLEIPLNIRSNVGKRMSSGESTPVGTRDSSTKTSRKDDSESDNDIWDEPSYPQGILGLM